MNPSYRAEIRNLSKVASRTSWPVYRKILGRLCQEYDNYEFTKSISGFVRNNDIVRLVEVADSLVEQKYPTATEHFVANQFASLIRKYPFPSDLNPFDPRKVAVEKFYEAERNCSVINRTFDPRVPEYRNPSFEPVLHRMRAWIRYVIGDSPVYSKVWSECSITPGASIGTHGNATNLARKIGNDWSVSPGALAYGLAAVRSNYQLVELLSRRAGSRFFSVDPDLLERAYLERTRVVNHNKIAFVPKTVKTFRSIAVEPFINSFIQKGIDVYMRRRLLRVGIDLHDQGVNSEMARLGSLQDTDESFVTIDLSSASDSIAREVVRDLLPPDWFEFLDSVRSRYFEIDGEIHRYEKFCSMGNGFCFPLETLIFASACVACGGIKAGDDFHVYGDDIIIKKRISSQVVAVLGYLGFGVNEKKTFLEGPFRESCGTDWFQGEDVRPFILDFALDSLSSYFKYLNLTQRSRRCQAFFSGVREYVISLIPPRLRLVRPYPGPSDTAYTVEKDLFMSSSHAKWDRSLQCWSWVELIHRPVNDHWFGLRDADISHLIAALSGSSSQAPFTLRRKTRTTMRRVAHG